MLEKEVQDIKLGKLTFSQLVDKMGEGGGFSAKNLSIAVNILETMNKDECIKILSFPACIVSTGMRGIIAQMIEKGLVDIIVTTCGTLDHDLARAWGGKYYQGSFELDDNKLHQEGVNRLGNILIPNKSYGEPLEENMNPILEELYKEKKEWSGRELIHQFGLRVKDEGSILHQAAKRNIPIYVPGITDGAFGTNLVWFAQNHDFKLNILDDEKELNASVFRNDIKLGALMIGGGISKHHTIWHSQFRGGLDYAVFITTATQYDGSLSGARLEEAVSWGKIRENARYTTVDGDATIILPFILSALYERL
ncbi:MAG: deoxyhypusine synthase [Nanoarchaeota archaeon]|nr:deoxyhypusine synthase [Nanoarchaeota archaeon]MBU4123864.1 deoxyhypusine synthase [Nanoarchaeota archaeon]